jgi:hypothetical protein
MAKSRRHQLTRKPKARDRAWQSMRILRQFTVIDLMATAEMTHANASAYIRALARSGYLRVAQPAKSVLGGQAVYQLVRDTGPYAPRLQTDGRTYDVNTHQIYEGGLKQ